MERSKRLSVFTVFMLALVPHHAPAQTVNDAAGLSAPLDGALAPARAAAMGSAFTAVADDASALLWNPAGLGNLSSGELSLHHQDWVAGTRQETLLFSLPLGRTGGVGLSTHYVDYGTFDGRDGNGALTTGFSARRLGLGAGWGRNWGRLSTGVGLRASQQNLAGRAYTAFSGDGGILLETSPGITLGLALVDLGKASGGSIPTAFRLGASLRRSLSPGWSLLAAGSGSLEKKGLNRFQTGVEAVYQGRYALRAGYQFDMVENRIEGLKGLTAGAGYGLKGFGLDYAFLPFGDLGTSHRVSLSYRFQAAKPLRTGQAPAGKAAEVESLIPGSSMDGSPALPLASDAPITGGGPSAAPEEEGLEIQFKLPPDKIRRGRELESQGKYPEAIALYTQAIQSDQKNLLAWWGLGNIYVRLGKRDHAIQCFERVLQIKPEAARLRDWLERYRKTAPQGSTSSR